MDSQLQATLAEYLESGWQSNPALRTLIHDYTKYHVVLVVAGGIVLLASVILAVLFWVRFKRVPKARRFKWPFEKKVFFAFGSALTIFSLFFALVCAANLSTVLKPLPGFASLARSTTVPSNSAAAQALTDWVRSGSTTFPPVLKQKVQDRVNWQRPKAIVCGLLLGITIVVSLRLWSYLIKKSRAGGSQWSAADRLLIAAGVLGFGCCIILAIMVVANAQGAIGPIAISLLGAGG